MLIILYIYVWIRATLPRLRYDQLMDLGWKRLIPAALAMLMIVAGFQISYAWGLRRLWRPAPRARRRAVLRAIDVGREATEVEAAREQRLEPGGGRMSFLDFFKGFVVTGKLPFKPKVTTQYPEEKRPKPERFHGRHVLNRYEDGMEKCIGCELCAGVCPARCIYVRGADNPPDAPVSPGERYGFVYEINFLRCIHCDMCVEACPTEAITESKLFEWSFINREDAIYTKAELLVDDEGHPQRAALGGLEGRATTATPRPGCGPPARPVRRHGGPAAVVRRARLRRPPGPEGPERPGAPPTIPPTPICPCGR